jgi:uncharacterized metal-binding protein (TIGR02443 family)
MADTPPRPQFIAGAVCPSCHVMDRIVLVGNADDGERRCVACGYSDARLPGVGTLPVTRFSRPPSSESDRSGQSGNDSLDLEQVSAVKIIDPRPPKN